MNEQINQQSNQQINQATSKSKNIWLIIMLVVIIGLIIAGYFIYLNKEKTIKDEKEAKAELEANIAEILEKLETAETRVAELEAEIEAAKAEAAVNPQLRVISPNGGETFCIGSPMTISWESQNTGEVSIHLMRYNTTGGGDGIRIAIVPIENPGELTQNEFEWDGSPTWLPTIYNVIESSNYAISVTGVSLTPGGPSGDDLSDKYFRLENCD